MSANRSRKRRLSDISDDYLQDHGPRRSRRLQLRAASNVQPEAPTQHSFPSHPPPPPLLSAARYKRSRGLGTTQYRITDGQIIIPSPSSNDQMEQFTFFSFPGELRNMIYDYSLCYPDSRQLFAPYYRRPSANKTTPTSKWKPRLRTPTILLLNKRITNECLPILKSTKLVINRLPPPVARDIHTHYFHNHEGHPQPSLFMRLSDFISPRTLQKIPQIDINVGLCEGPLGSGWAWAPVVYELLTILLQRNACSKLRLLIRLCNTQDYPLVWRSDQDYHVRMIKKLEKFAGINPNFIACPEVRMETWSIVGQMATYVEGTLVRGSLKMALAGDQSLKANPSDEEGEPQTGPAMLPRPYPDKEMFPGSVMEFVRPAPPPLYSVDEWD